MKRIGILSLIGWTLTAGCVGDDGSAVLGTVGESTENGGPGESDGADDSEAIAADADSTESAEVRGGSEADVTETGPDASPAALDGESESTEDGSASENADAAEIVDRSASEGDGTPDSAPSEDAQGDVREALDARTPDDTAEDADSSSEAADVLPDGSVDTGDGQEDVGPPDANAEGTEGAGKLGDECTGDEDCEAAFACINDPPKSVCSQPCDGGNCPEGTTCQNPSGGGSQESSWCLPAK